MPSPFPGMDPYLERRDLWRDVHAEFIHDIRHALNPYLSPKYTAYIETRVYVSLDDDQEGHDRYPDLSIRKRSGSKRRGATAKTATAVIDEPIVFTHVRDPEIQENYLVIKKRSTNTIVTSIEVMSPTNKAPNSAGRRSYMEKREELLLAKVHVIDIDFLRGGLPPFTLEDRTSAYRVFLTRHDELLKKYCWLIDLRHRLPVIGVPLADGDPDVPLDLGEVMKTVYECGTYADKLDYSKPCNPPLPPADQRWANKLLRSKGLR